VTAQVLFFPTFYQPTDEVRRKLIYFQEQMTIYHAELAYKMKGLSRGEQYLYKERSHNAVRDTWLIYTGFKGEMNRVDKVSDIP
jgi:hypothetical protein